MTAYPNLPFVDVARGEARWNRGRWCWAVWALLPALASLPLALISGTIPIVQEGGLAESTQAGLLLVAAVASLVVASRLADHRCRNCTLLLGALAALFLARELDLHVLVNPEHFGAWGVRFRLDWWLSGSVGPAIKIVWAAVFALVAGILTVLARRSAGPLDWRRARPRLTVLFVVMYAVGFACDDLLRGVIDLRIAQAIEETAELIAAAALLGATLGPESSVPCQQRDAAPRRA